MNKYSGVVSELMEAAQDGEQFTVNEVMQKTGFDTKVVLYLLTQLKKKFRSEQNIYFGQVAPGVYGLALKKAEFAYAYQQGYSRVRNAAVGLTLLHNEGIKRLLILPAAFKQESLSIGSLTHSK